jgi:hypothetical protein
MHAIGAVPSAGVGGRQSEAGSRRQAVGGRQSEAGSRFDSSSWIHRLLNRPYNRPLRSPPGAHLADGQPLLPSSRRERAASQRPSGG